LGCNEYFKNLSRFDGEIGISEKSKRISIREYKMEFILENEEYLTLDEVEKLVDLKQTSIYTLVRFGSFPKPRKLEIRQAWKRSEIDLYLEGTRDVLKE
jgi:predicted DNA-binding transcriptional regulator AlpA